MREQIEHHIAAGELEAAGKLIRILLTQSVDAAQWVEASWALRKRAQCRFMRGEADAAVEAARQALEYAKQSDNPVEEAEAENALGILQGDRGELVTAVKHLERSYRLHERAGSNQAAAVLNNIGNTCLIMDDPRRALRYFRKALKAARENGDQGQIEGTALANIGRALHDLGRYGEASDALQESVDLFTRLEIEPLRIHSVAKLASTLKASGNAESAESLYRQAIGAAQERGDQSWIYELHGNLAMLLIDQERFDDAEPLLVQALAGAADVPGAADLPAWRMRYSVILERNGDKDGALQQMRSAFEVLERISEQRAERGLFQAMARLEMERMERENEQYRRENEELAAALREVDTLRRELEARNAELSELVIRDPLTSLLNRRWFMDQLPTEIQRARRYGHALTVVVIDLDHFKSVNDTFGHSAGDRVLIRFAEITTANTRATDSVARYGGEEFAILMPETTPEDAAAACEKLRSVLANTDWSADGIDSRLTFSAGIAELQDEDTPDTLIDRADRRLYLAKDRGRDRIVTEE